MMVGNLYFEFKPLTDEPIRACDLDIRYIYREFVAMRVTRSAALRCITTSSIRPIMTLLPDWTQLNKFIWYFYTLLDYVTRYC